MNSVSVVRDLNTECYISDLNRQTARACVSGQLYKEARVRSCVQFP
jgi:hypothetical protein